MKKKEKNKIIFLVSFLVLSIAILGVICLYTFRDGVLSGSKDKIASEGLSGEEETISEQQSPALPSEEEALEVTVLPAEHDMESDRKPEEDSGEPEIQDVTMVFGGDICFYDAYANMSSLRSRGGNIESSVDIQLLSEMRNADICMVNNEFAYSDRGAPLAGKKFTFRSKPQNVNLLKDMGVDIVSLANNHVYDYGEEALLDTLDVLKGEGIPYVGAGKNLEEASAAYYFEINGRKLAFLSATQVERNSSPDTKGAAADSPGAFRCFSAEEFQNLLCAIEKAEKEADITIVYIHWGSENTDELHWAQNEQAPQIVAAGADLIVGDHPHVLQGIDYIDGVPVFYSMGNFWFNSKTLDTGMLKAVYTKDGNLECQFIPAKQHDCRTDMESGSEKQRILDYLQCISPNITIDADGNVKDKPYDGPQINYSAVERVPAPPASLEQPELQPAVSE